MPLGRFDRNRAARDGYNNQCKACKKEASHKWRRSRAWQDSWLRRTYGITIDDFESLLVMQDGCCAICLREMEAPQVDHCHTTGEIRGLLCMACNIALGKLEDDTERLARAIDYLRTPVARVLEGVRY
jgi:Recombination endonuclease VII